MEQKPQSHRKDYLKATKDDPSRHQKFQIDLRKKVKQNLFRMKRQKRSNPSLKLQNETMRIDSLGRIILDSEYAQANPEDIRKLEGVCPVLFEQDISFNERIIQVREILIKGEYEERICILLCTYLRVVSSSQDSEVTKMIVKEGLFPILMKLASLSLLPLTLEITWTLTNITSLSSPEITQYILGEEFHLLTYLKEMMVHPNDKVKEHAIWSLSNLMPNDESPFEEIFQTGIIDAISTMVMGDKMPLGLLRVLAWALSNIARCKVRNREFIQFIVEVGCTFLFVADEEIICDSIFAIKHLTDCEEENEELEMVKLDTISEAVLMPKLISFLDQDRTCFPQAFKVVINLSSSNCDTIHTQILKENFFSKASTLLSSQNLSSQITKEIFFTCSNLVAHSEGASTEFINSEMLNCLLGYIETKEYNDVKREAFWCFANMVERAVIEDRIKLVKEKNVIKLMLKMIIEATKELRIITILLPSLDKLLDTSIHFQETSIHHPLLTFQSEEGLTLLENLQTSPNAQVFLLAQNILKKHYPGGDEQEMGEEQDGGDELTF